MQKINKITFLAIFILSLVFTPNSVGATSHLQPGTLIKLEGVEGAAVYQIGSDGKKYVYPDQRTFSTWFDNFGDVVAVDQETLDEYEDGGTVTFQPGTRLLTHRNTAKVYAVGEDGELVYIPDEQTAINFYGQDWAGLVSDIDPGIFAIAYRIAQHILSENSLPEGSLVEDEQTGNYYLIEDGQKRFVSKALLRLKNLHRKHALKIKRIANLRSYDDGDDIDEDNDDDIASFTPRDKVILCHKPGVADVTIRVAESAVKAHLAHGDTRGKCGDDSSNDDNDDDSDDNDDNDDTNTTVDIKVSDIAFGTNVPMANVTTTITAYIENSGEVSLTNPDPIFNVLVSLEDFSVDSVTTSTVSSVDKLDKGEKASIVWTGKFTSDGEKIVSVTTDYADNLDESNEDNNTRIETVTVLAEGQVDLMVSDITWDPESPVKNATTTITAYIKNSGTVDITNSVPVFDVLASLKDFVVSSTSTSTVSVAEPLEPEQEATITWTGYFSSTGDNKLLSVTVDESDTLDESDESNNNHMEYVDV